MIAIPQSGTITYSLFGSKGKRDRNVKAYYINAGQNHWSWEIRDSEFSEEDMPAGSVEASSLVEAVERIAIAVVAQYSGSYTPKEVPVEEPNR